MTERKTKKIPPKKRYDQNDAHGASSKFGQMIGEAFASVIYRFIGNHLLSHYPDYELLSPAEGKRVVRLEMPGGTFRQMDNVIALKNSIDPVALFESKWLKDARHHNDKGGWILQLREVRKKYPTVRGAVANLAGYWTEGVGVMFESEGRVKMVLVATDEEVYSTLQPPLDKFLAENQLPEIKLDVKEIRGSLPRSWDMANFLMAFTEKGILEEIAFSWLEFERKRTAGGNSIYGKDVVIQAIDELLSPLPENPSVQKFEITLQIDTGNVIYCEFDDIEQAQEFLQMYASNPKAILDKITPRSKNE